jgi:hypothetical protein
MILTDQIIQGDCMLFRITCFVKRIFINNKYILQRGPICDLGLMLYLSNVYTKDTFVYKAAFAVFC